MSGDRGTGLLVANSHAWTTIYDVFNRRITESDPLNRTTTYGYGIGVGGCSSCHSEPKVTEIISPSGKVTRITYNAEWQKLSETTGFGTPEAATISYTYNTVGNLVSTTDPRGKVWTFTYDNRHRRITATDPLGHITRWTYDAAGNNLTETRPDGRVTTNTYDVMNRLLTTRNPNNETTTFAYGGTGAAGDQGDNLITLTDARGNSYTFTRDAKNRCIARTINGTTTLYIFDGWNLIDEHNSSDTQQAKYIHGPAIDEMLVRTTLTGPAYYHQDGLGSTTALTNATGAIKGQACYYAPQPDFHFELETPSGWKDKAGYFPEGPSDGKGDNDHGRNDGYKECGKLCIKEGTDTD
jgi:YD repeat-containing protein